MKKNIILLSIIHSFIFYSCSAQPESNSNKEYKEEIHQISDSLVEYKSYYANNKLKEQSFYNLDNELHGKSKEWHEDGSKKLEWNYVKNVLHGEQIRWDENGNIQSLSNYVFGQKNGKQFNFDKGDTLYVETYDHGKLLHKYTPADYYSPPPTFMKDLMSEGLDSITALRILKNGLSGYIVKDKNISIFIEDSTVTGIIGSTVNQAKDISRNNLNQLLTEEYLISKGLTKKQIKDLYKKGFIKLNSNNR